MPVWVPSFVLPLGVGGWAKKLLQPEFGPLNIVEYIHKDVYPNICECLFNPIQREFLPKVFQDEKPIHLKSLTRKTMYKKSYIENLPPSFVVQISKSTKLLQNKASYNNYRRQQVSPVLLPRKDVVTSARG